MAGFVRSAIPGEYSSQPIHNQGSAVLSTSSTTPSIFLPAKSFYVETPFETVNFIFTGHWDNVNAGNTPPFQLVVDGISRAVTRKTYSFAGGGRSPWLIFSSSGFSPGWHTAWITWNSTGAGNQITFHPVNSGGVNYSQFSHSNFVIRRNQDWSDKEMASFGQMSWPAIYTSPTIFKQLVTSTISDSNNSAVTLLGSLIAPTKLTNSSLLIRFQAMGTSGAPTNVNTSVKFRIYVDGIAQIGFGSQGQFSPTGRFDAEGMCVVPVTQGNHLIEVYWGGGTATSTITPSLVIAGVTCSPTEHACIQVEEVFCFDVGNRITDMNGFAISNYSPLNVPQVRYAILQEDVFQGGGAVEVSLLSLTIDVDSEESWFVIESTTGSAGGGGCEVFMRIDDGSNVGGTYMQPNSGTTSFDTLPISWVVKLSFGVHTIRTYFIDGGLTAPSVAICPATHPDWSHSTLLVREYSPAQY